MLCCVYWQVAALASAPSVSTVGGFCKSHSQIRCLKLPQIKPLQSTSMNSEAHQNSINERDINFSELLHQLVINDPSVVLDCELVSASVGNRKHGKNCCASITVAHCLGYVDRFVDEKRA